MLQISQTENPICSATIDQMRLRRATTLPVLFQKVSSSGFHSEIQVGFCLLIKDFLSERHRRGYRGIALEGIEARSGEAPVLAVCKSDGWFRWTAAMASAPAIQALCQAAATRKISILQNVIDEAGGRLPTATRRQNLRFAHLLCVAQQMSRGIRT